MLVVGQRQASAYLLGDVYIGTVNYNGILEQIPVSLPAQHAHALFPFGAV